MTTNNTQICAGCSQPFSCGSKLIKYCSNICRKQQSIREGNQNWKNPAKRKPSNNFGRTN